MPRLMRSSAVTHSGPKSSNGTPPPLSKASATLGADANRHGTISNMPPAKWSAPEEERTYDYSRTRGLGRVAGGRHALQPRLDVARLQARGADHLVEPHRARALHGAEQARARADIDHAGAHRASHVAEDVLDGSLGFFAIHDQGYR